MFRAHSSPGLASLVLLAHRYARVRHNGYSLKSLRSFLESLSLYLYSSCSASDALWDRAFCSRDVKEFNNNNNNNNNPDSAFGGLPGLRQQRVM